MKCQILFSRKTKKNIISLFSAEFAHSMVNVKGTCLMVLTSILRVLSQDV